jgi:glutathione synthase/RimK-type ligase-like ATP-grasp enzyme
VGKEIVGAVLRLSKDGKFKANFSLGGTAEPYTLNAEEREMVMRIADHFDFGMAGIDFIFDEKGGFLFNEIEDVAGSRTLSMTSGTDIVRLYLDHIINILNTSQNI